MIKTYRIYLRLSKNGKMSASKRPSFKSLGGYYSKTYLPTIQIALDLKIDEKEFEATRILLEKTITGAKPCVEIEESCQKGEK